MSDRVPSTVTFAEQVARATGLAGMLADGAVRRCCVRAGIDMSHLRPRDLVRVLPQLEAVLSMYLSVPEAAAGLDRLQRLAEGHERTEPFGRAPLRPPGR